jgi:hypothetical protein
MKNFASFKLVMLSAAALYAGSFAATANAQTGSALALAAISLSSSKTPETAASPQACPPAGYIVSEEGGRLHSIVKNGERLYCVQKDKDKWWLAPECGKYVPAAEYIRAQTGRADATYSGMALQGGADGTIVLFYCLPTKR